MGRVWGVIGDRKRDEVSRISMPANAATSAPTPFILVFPSPSPSSSFEHLGWFGGWISPVEPMKSSSNPHGSYI